MKDYNPNTTPPCAIEFYYQSDPELICGGCNVRELWEHRCFGKGHCKCNEPICMASQDRITDAQLKNFINGKLVPLSDLTEEQAEEIVQKYIKDWFHKTMHIYSDVEYLKELISATLKADGLPELRDTPFRPISMGKFSDSKQWLKEKQYKWDRATDPKDILIKLP